MSTFVTEQWEYTGLNYSSLHRKKENNLYNTIINLRLEID